MKFSRICFLGLLVAVCSVPMVGCKGGDSSGIDAPLTKDAPPPPNRPNKADVSPKGAGGGAGGAQGAAATP